MQLPSRRTAMRCTCAALLLILVRRLPAAEPSDVMIRGGTVYDGSGKAPIQADVALRGDKVAGVGNFDAQAAKVVVDAKGLTVAPGFINMLSWSNESLLADGRSQGEVRQGVPTQIMAEGD